jgi:hypothetical protein
VRDGFGVGIVSEAVLNDEKGLTIRLLDPSTFRPIEAKLICRRMPGTSHSWISPSRQSHGDSHYAR